jgi:spore coat polysaccharide biosynthesis predicted glycosyltransferase SpsG
LAVSAAGGSQFELLACAVPAMLVVVAENQKNASQEAASQGWCKVFNVDDLDADELAMQCISLWQKPELLGLMHQKALEFPVVDGAKNIVELMSGHKLTSDDTE